VSAGSRLSAARAASHEVPRRSGDSDPQDQGGHGFPPDPSGVRYAPRVVVQRAVGVTGVSRRPPLRFRSSSETCHRNPAPRRRATDPKAGGRHVPRCCLSWALVPYDTVPDRRIRFVMAANPSAAACRVRGLDTSFATYTTGPPGARSAGASMGLTLQGVLLGARGAPLGVPALLTLPPQIHLPKEEERRTAAYRASFPRRVRAATGLPEEPGRRYLPGLLPFRASTPSVRAIACSHDACPLALGRDDVPTHLGLRASRSGWIGLVRFRTACSPGVSHLSTVTALRSSSRGAGSCFHLTREATHDTRPRPRSELPRRRCSRGS
jgi:hypothetical protein